MLRIVFLGHWINPKPKNRDCRFSLHSKRLPNPLDKPKAFQTNTQCLFCFFNAPQLTKASFRRCVALKKPLICMRGFVAGTGIEPVFAP